MFKKGDIIQFKTWGEMAKQYGVDNNGAIKCRGYFTKAMRRDCNYDKKYVISEITSSHLNPKVQTFVQVTEPDSFFREYLVSVDMIKPVDKRSDKKKKKVEILISSDNTKYTNATLKINGIVVNTAVAKCDPEDTFSIQEGARIAIERVMKNIDDAPKSRKNKKQYYYYYRNYNNTKAKYDGVGGEETNYKDVNGKKLVVGDVVCVIGEDGTYYGSAFVLNDGKDFIDGIYAVCNSETGEIGGGFTIVKQRSYNENIDDLLDKDGKINNMIRVYE